MEQRWRDFRAKNHQKFLQDTVNSIRELFPAAPIFTHQIAVLDEESFIFNYRRQDLASPQWTAFVDGANPGFTVYTYSGDQDGKKERFVSEVRSKLGGRTWGFLEFNTAQAFPGTKQELAAFTQRFLNKAKTMASPTASNDSLRSKARPPKRSVL
jgi:hypothetical protein